MMKNRIKNLIISLNIFITKLFHSALSIFIVILFSKFSSRGKIKKNRNCCFILGNGPSLRNDFDSLCLQRHKYDIFCINDFPFRREFEEIKPDFYSCIDPFYWENKNVDQECNLEGLKIINEIVIKASWPIALIIPFEMKNLVKISKIQSNELVTVIYFNRVFITGFRRFTYLLFKSGLAMPHAQNILNSVLFAAINMRYRNIFISGADHSWHEEIVLGKDNIVYLKQIHFYDQKELVDLQPAYKNNVYINGSYQPFMIHEIFEAWAKCFKTYHILDDYAKFRNSNIFNVSNKTFIDAFKRIEFQQINNLPEYAQSPE